MTRLEIRDLWVSVEGKQILKGVDLTVNQGEIHSIMGPNGSGKTTLAYVIMGHPKYVVEKGDILLDGESILSMSPDERARRGLFLAFQYPITVSGVTVANFLRRAYLSMKGSRDKESEKLSVIEFQKLLNEKLKLLKLESSIVRRYLNEGFSGGEKKKAEILQLAVLQPKIAILDETDSGLDIDSIRIIADGINRICSQISMGVLLITHYARILNYIRPSYVHVMFDGSIVVSGESELAQELEEKGYGWIKDKYAKHKS